MFNGLNFHLDIVSFILGLVTGALFWVFWLQLRRHQPEIQARLQDAFKQFQERHFSGVETAIRQEALRRSQRTHLAARLFPLDEILIPPKCLMPLPMIEPGSSETDFHFSPSVFPSMLDWPELPSQFGTEFISLPAALQKNANVVLFGQAGAGKTTALAHLAGLMARQDPSLGILQKKVPLFLHILDILPQYSPDAGTPTEAMIHEIIAPLPILAQNRAPTFLKSALAEGNALLLLDGLDELAPTELIAAVNLIASVMRDLPDLQIVLTSSLSYLDGILKLGFQPLSLACWNREGIEKFIQTWTEAWEARIAPDIRQKTGVESLAPAFLRNWIQPEAIHHTPLDWTLILWSACASDGGAISAAQALETFLLRLLTNPALITPIQTLAIEMLNQQKTSFDQNILDELLSRASLSQFQLFDPSQGQPEEEPSQHQPATEKNAVSLSMQWVMELVHTGLFFEHTGHILRFCHPAALAWMAAQCPIEKSQAWLEEKISWEPRQLAIAYSSGKNLSELALSPETIQGTPPLFRAPLNWARMLKYLPSSHPLRTRLLKRMAEGILDAKAIPATRVKFASALVCANDPSVSAFFRQQLSSPQTAVRLACSLAIGALRDEKALEPLTQLLDDPDEDVRKSACFALGEMRDKNALQILSDCLAADDEVIRRSSAEALAGHPPLGYPILKEAVASGNLITRRSAVFGLARIDETWARENLAQMATQDGQWVVRNAASQALDNMEKLDPCIPRRLIPPSKSPWLFNFASKLGKGIPTDDEAIEILKQALRTGDVQEQLAALAYLCTSEDENVRSELSYAALNSHPPVHDSAQQALLLYETSRTDQTKVSRVSIGGENG